MTDEVEELLRVLGPFYELIEEKKKISHISDVSTGGVFFRLPTVSLAYFLFLGCQTTHRAQPFHNLPLIQRLARLTMFARQLEGKYVMVLTFNVSDTVWYS